MSISLIVSLLVGYFSILVLISYLTTRKTTSNTFYTGDKSSPWYLVAFGMIGASLSGVTFLSVPGWVADTQFAYMQMVFGYVLGYFVIAYVLMPIYYKLNLVSIYQYLDQRFGNNTYKTGASFFLLSRTIGAAFRLYLVAITLQIILFDKMDVPFWLTVLITIALIWLYTYRGGIKTVVWTDTLQTFFMLLALGICLYKLIDFLDFEEGVVTKLSQSKYTQMFFFDSPEKPTYFFKQFFSGAFIAIVMTGLDQDMMQKNLTCRNLRDAQKNMVVFSLVLVVVNLLFMSLGALLYEFRDSGIVDINMGSNDSIFAHIATEYLGPVAGVALVLGVIAAAYSSADSALTSLTTSVSVDFLGASTEKPIATSRRNLIHFGFSILLFGLILLFQYLGDKDASIVGKLFKAAGFTYGPLLGLYAFGIFTRFDIRDRLVPVVCVLSPVLWFVLNMYSKEWFGFEFGFEILIYNGLTTFLGMFLFLEKKEEY